MFIEEMISGKSCDMLDSKKSLFKQPFVVDDVLPNSKDSFSDICSTPQLLPYKNDVYKFVKENVNIFEEVIFGDAQSPQPSLSKDSAVETTFVERTNSEYVQAASKQVTHNNTQHEVNSSCWIDEQSCNKTVENATVYTPSNCNIPPCCKLVTSNSAGAYGFFVQFVELTDVITKSIHYTYSEKLNKLFVQKDELCPIRFKCDLEPPCGSVVKVIARFKDSQSAATPVKTCLLHKDCATKNPLSVGHLIQIFKPHCDVSYEVTPEGQESTSFVFERNSDDSEFQTIRFIFTCLSSCKSGINRRPTEILFQLESADGMVIGRQVVDFCVCTRPGRDRLREENKSSEKKTKRAKRKKNGTTSANNSEPDTKLRKDTDEVFTMIIHGRKKYEKLLQIKEAFDLAELVDEEQREKYYQNQASQ